ncbi:MAG: outer membrane lipoprotein chaperone LolA [Gammaproteobacteria bacterium]
MTRLYILYLVFVALISSPTIASAEEPAQATGPESDLHHFLTDVSTLAAGFRQQLFDSDGRSIQESRGRFYIQRPGRFRWEYDQPEQLVVCDGQLLWMYDYDLEQVTVRTVDDTLRGTPAMLLSGQGQLDDSFEIGASYEEDNLAWLELTPRGENPEFKGVRAGLSDGHLAVMEVRDSLDQVTRIEFHDLELDLELESGLFEFTPPEGVDVIGEGVDF